MSNIPIYRAKSNENKTSYVEGLLISVLKEVGLCVIRTNKNYLSGEICCLDTLSIHFPDMIDSQGNKIFASLNIKGGSLIEYEEKIFEAMYLNGLIQGITNMDSIQKNLFKYSKITGIKE